MKTQFDINAFAQKIINSGYLNDYNIALGSDVNLSDPSVYSDIKCPAFPGASAYWHGPGVLTRNERDLPQEIIESQRQSVRDLLKILMPQWAVSSFLCEFYQRDFMKCNAYKNVEKEHIGRLPSPDKEESHREYNSDISKYIPEEASFQFNDPRHKSFNRQYYTMNELRVVKNVIETKPEIYRTVFAFMAGTQTYFDVLTDALHENGDLSLRKKIKHIQQSLKNAWSGNNFTSNLLPAFCLAYHERDPSGQSNIQSADFKRGYEIAIKIGVFQHTLANDDTTFLKWTGKRHFKCPAQATIGAAISFNDGNPPSMGAMLGNICNRIYALQSKHPAAMNDNSTTLTPN